MSTTTFIHCETNYAAQKGVTIKIERHDHAPGHQEYLFAQGPGHPEWFPCLVDSFGNVCDDAGLVVFPSMSGAHPLTAGEHGYFGNFAENFSANRENHPEFPSVKTATSLKAARISANLTQRQLSDLSGVNVRQIQRVELGEAEAGNLTAKNLLALADALGVDPRDLI